MNTTIKNRKGNSTLILELDFNQVLNENFEEICKAISVRGKALKELVSIFENNNELIETILQAVKKFSGENEASNNLCKELHVSYTTAQYLIDMSLEDLTSLSLEKLKNEYEEYRKAIDLM